MDVDVNVNVNGEPPALENLFLIRFINIDIESAKPFLIPRPNWLYQRIPTLNTLYSSTFVRAPPLCETPNHQLYWKQQK